ncbi:MAG: DUF1624 domain-containing protein [Eubacterium sp.]|nr:DUF1624 domain-containing protein [Eubacterium sp.]
MSYNEWIKRDKVNLGRQQEVDLARAIPVISLPFVHCVIECCSTETINKPIPFLFNVIIGAPLGAPIFMFSMGISLIYSKHASSKDLMKRGLILFIAGFLLNILRFGIPYLTGYLITGEYERYISPILFKIFGNDILQFAGLALMLLGFLKKNKLSDMTILAIAVAMSLIGWNFRHLDLKNDVLNIVLGHFIGTEAPTGYVLSDFPILNWFLVPVAGYIFGNILIRIRDKKKFYLPFIPILAVIYWTYFAIESKMQFGKMAGGATIVEEENAYYHAEFFDIISYIVCAIGMLGVYYLISSHCPKKLNQFFCSVSRNITRIYIIHWFFVVMSTNVIIYKIKGTQELPVYQIMLLALGIFLISYFGALWIEKKQRQKKER